MKILHLPVVIILTISIAITCKYLTSPDINEVTEVNQIQVVELISDDSINIIENGNKIMTNACYAYGADNFNELKSMADAIVRAKVVKHEHLASFTTLSHLEVIELISGSVPNAIVLYQLGTIEMDNVVVEDGYEYILFLNVQESERFDNGYCITSGTEGIFKIDGQDVTFKGDVLKKEFSDLGFEDLANFVKWMKSE